MQVRRHWATTRLFSSAWVWPFRDTANLEEALAGHRSLKRKKLRSSGQPELSAEESRVLGFFEQLGARDERKHLGDLFVRSVQSAKRKRSA